MTSCVLVIGTTADYIEILTKRLGKRILFLTSREERESWPGEKPTPAQEILTNLEDFAEVQRDLKQQLTSHKIQLSGIACYDCESMRLAARLAIEYKLSYVSEEAVLLSRSKFHSKSAWQKANVDCPMAGWINSADAAVKFWKKIKSSVVLKPLTGSGSELIFRCDDAKSCRVAFDCISQLIAGHSNQRMYGAVSLPDGFNHDGVVGIEQFIGGTEYSADFLLEMNRVRIIRLSRKIPHQQSTFGTVLAYELLQDTPEGLSEDHIANELKKAAHALGITRALAMADFKIENGKMYFIEMTPRPGGDCLPPLIEAASGFDMLKAKIDFAQGLPLDPPQRNAWKPLIGVQLVAAKAGMINTIDIAALTFDPRVIKCHLKRKPGDEIKLPPEDYDLRSLGYVIARADPKIDIEHQAKELASKLKVTFR